MTKVSIGIPIVTSLTAFVLVLLALFSGTGDHVFLEEFDIITFNTSELGKDLVSKSSSSPSSTSSVLCQGIGGNWLGSACASATAAVASDVASALDKIEDDVVDKLAQALGIRQFYSLHTMNICEGYYQPRATAQGASHNVTNCTVPFSGYNVSAIFDHELSVGPLKLNLDDLGFSDDLQAQFDAVYRLVEAFAIIFIVGAGFAGLSLISSAISLFLIPRHEHVALLTNVILSGTAMGILIIAVTLVTAGAYVGASKINERGSDIGISVSAGHNFTIVSWTAVGLTVITFIYWTVHHRSLKRGVNGVAGRHHKTARDSEESYEPPQPMRETTVRTDTTTRRPPPTNRERWGRFHEGVSWNSFPSRLSFFSNRHSRAGN